MIAGTNFDFPSSERYRDYDFGNRKNEKKFLWSRPGNCHQSRPAIWLVVASLFCQSRLESFAMARKENIEGAFVHLIAEHQSELRAFVTSLMPGSHEIDDVIQEANKVVWEKRGEFEIGSNFKAWMFSVAKFQIRAAWRDQKRKKEWSVPESVLTKMIEETIASSDHNDLPDHDILHECLQRLRPQDRSLILRRYFDGWRVKKVAFEAGRNADSVKVSLRRIRSLIGLCIRKTQRLKEVRA